MVSQLGRFASGESRARTSPAVPEGARTRDLARLQHLDWTAGRGRPRRLDALGTGAGGRRCRRTNRLGASRRPSGIDGSEARRFGHPTPAILRLLPPGPEGPPPPRRTCPPRARISSTRVALPGRACRRPGGGRLVLRAHEPPTSGSSQTVRSAPRGRPHRGARRGGGPASVPRRSRNGDSVRLSHSPSVRSGGFRLRELLLSQLPSQDLAHEGHRKGGRELDGFRDLECREALLAECDDFLLRRGLSALQDHERLDRLAAVLVRHPDGRGFPTAGCMKRTSSTSRGYTLYPEQRIMSFLRSTM